MSHLQQLGSRCIECDSSRSRRMLKLINEMDITHSEIFGSDIHTAFTQNTKEVYKLHRKMGKKVLVA